MNFIKGALAPKEVKAADFTDRIAALTEQFHRGYGFLPDQVNRAALPIAANIAEGNGP